MPTEKKTSAELRPEFDHLYVNTPSLFEFVTEAQFQKSMRMANTDRAIGSIDWLQPVTVESIRASVRSER